LNSIPLFVNIFLIFGRKLKIGGLLTVTSAEYGAAVMKIRDFASTEGFLFESVSFATPDLITTQVTLVMSATSTSTIDVLITEVIIIKTLQLCKLPI